MRLHQKLKKKEFLYPCKSLADRPLAESLGTGWFSKENRVLGPPSESGVLASNFPRESQRKEEKETPSSQTWWLFTVGRNRAILEQPLLATHLQLTGSLSVREQGKHSLWGLCDGF